MASSAASQVQSNLRKLKPFKAKAEVRMPTAKQIKASGVDKSVVKNAFVVGSLRASTIVEAELPAKLTEAMESPVWGPFGAPKYPYNRKNGESAGAGSRDLIDTGALHDSLHIKTNFLATRTQTLIEYRSPYAAITHYGGVIQPYGNKNAASVILPARPWVTSLLTGEGPVKRYDINKIYEQEIQKAFG